MHMERFRIGIIGAGHIAEKMAYTLGRMDDAEAYGIASRDIARAGEFARRHNVRKAYGSYEEMAEDPEIQLIYVATPHSLHFPHVKMCLEKDKPVLCEKSFMLNRAEAEETVRISEEKGVFLAEAIWTRYMPFRKTVSDILRSGRIGTPMMITAHLGYPVAGKERIVSPGLGGGALLDIDLQRYGSRCLRPEFCHDDVRRRHGENRFIMRKIPFRSRHAGQHYLHLAGRQDGCHAGYGHVCQRKTGNNQRRQGIYRA